MSQLHGDFLSFCGFQSPHIAHMFASLLQSKAHESFWSLKYLLTWCWTRRCGRTQHNALWYGTELRTASCVILSVTGSIHNFTASHLMKNSAKASAKINKKSASKRINFETVISCVCVMLLEQRERQTVMVEMQRNISSSFRSVCVWALFSTYLLNVNLVIWCCSSSWLTVSLVHLFLSLHPSLCFFFVWWTRVYAFVCLCVVFCGKIYLVT